jgi:NAD(P) transhydrogenase subunit alpha
VRAPASSEISSGKDGTLVKVGIPKETAPGERRVALVPESVARLVSSALEVIVERGAGAASFHSDPAYEQAGARIAPNATGAYEADVIAKVQRPLEDEVERLRAGQVLIGFLQPLTNAELVRALATKGVTAFAMEAIPRVTRAQAMDALSSQANIGGYKAVVLAAASLPKYLPMLTTAAGTIAPARVLVLGAGVAGLQAIATARRLGAIVEAFDTRAVVKEQVQSLGARFLEIELGESAEAAGGYAKELSEEAHRKEQELIARHAKDADIVITTAAIPGKRAPLLVTAEMVRSMRPGSVIVDLAAETGGNCELTEPGSSVVKHGVTIHGETNLPSTLAVHASQLYSRNVSSLLGLLVKDGKLSLDWNDEIVKGAAVTHDGKVVHAGAKALVESAGARA